MRTFLFSLILFTGIAEAQVNPFFETISFQAPLDDHEILNAEVGSCLDTSNRTHIAWIKDDGTGRYLMYSVYDPQTKQVTTQEINAGPATEVKIAPYIVTDKNNHPHITYILKRDANKGTKEGNYAVMYAGDPEGDGSFEVSQVSTNPTSPDISSNDLFNCYVNGRPNIIFNDDTIIVNYIADGNTNTSYDRYMIFARKTSGGWSHSQEFNTNDVGGTWRADGGMSFPLNMTPEFHGGFMEISNYSPRFMYKSGGTWNEVEITGYRNTFDNDHIQLEMDENDTLHYFWFNEDGNEKFCHTTISGGSYTPVVETPVANTPNGNFFPATVDRSNGDVVYFYNTTKNKGYVILFDEAGQPFEMELTNIGVTYGKENIHFNQGYISLVTAHEDTDKIYISTNTGGPPPPTVNSPLTFCEEKIDTIKASGTGILTWYDDSTLTTIIDTGEAILPTLTAGQHFLYVTDSAAYEGKPAVIEVNVQSIPEVNLGNDTTLTSVNSLTLDAGSGFDSYLWNTGKTTQQVTVDSNGTFYVNVTSGVCSGSDTINVTFVTGVEEMTNKTEVIAYPNPTKDNVYLNISGAKKGQILIEVHTLTGQVVFSKNMYAGEGDQQIRLPIGDLSDNIYWIHITNEANRQYIPVMLKK